MNKILYHSLNMGCDPEFFISTKDGKIVESSKVIPTTGKLEYKENYYNSTLVRDGVQIEINPPASSCRAAVAHSIRLSFKKLLEVLEKNNMEASFKSMVEFTPDEMKALDDESKKFGCAPSFNIHNKKAGITVDPTVYNKRTAGGHLHLEIPYGYKELAQKDYVVTFVRLFDTVIGNTCVLLDRDPNQIERRKVYGRAGEYRTPAHGLEYRTPSNFWLRSYPLMSLVFGLGRLAVNIGCNIMDHEHKDIKTLEKSPYRKIFRVCRNRDIQKAINTNDYDLAKKNWDKLRVILSEIISDEDYKGIDDYGHYPFCSKTMDMFEHFFTKGMDYWFKRNPIEDWLSLTEGHKTGWEAFCDVVVKADMKSKFGIKSWQYGGSSQWGNGYKVILKESETDI
jgi:hypothetical protein